MVSPRAIESQQAVIDRSVKTRECNCGKIELSTTFISAGCTKYNMVIRGNVYTRSSTYQSVDCGAVSDSSEYLHWRCRIQDGVMGDGRKQQEMAKNIEKQGHIGRDTWPAPRTIFLNLLDSKHLLVILLPLKIFPYDFFGHKTFAYHLSD